MATIRELERRLVRRRRRYHRARTRTNLRQYLRTKAELAVKRGHPMDGWDPRMCAYYPGISSQVNAGCKKGIVRAYAEGLVITSTQRFPVGGGSYHQARNHRGEGKAFDAGLIESEIGTTLGRNRMVRFQTKELARSRREGGQINGNNIVELIGPDNGAIILRDAETDLREGDPLENQHDNHVHEAYDD